MNQTIVLVADYDPVRMRERVKRIRRSEFFEEAWPVISMPTLCQALSFLTSTVEAFQQYRRDRPAFMLLFEADMPLYTLVPGRPCLTDLTSEELIHLLQTYDDAAIGRSATMHASTNEPYEFSLEWIDPEEEDVPPKSGTTSTRPDLPVSEAAAS